VEGYLDVIGLHQAGVANAVAVCGTALTPEHVELLSRCDCREVTILFDGDVAGLAAPAKAAQALFPAGMAGKVAVLPSDAGKTDPDEYARANGRAGVEALLASARPLSEFLVDRAVERTCGGSPRDAALEAKLAAVRDLAPFVRLLPEGLARSVFEDTVAKRLDLDLAALRSELSGERAERAGARSAVSAAPAPRPPAPRPAASRVRLTLPGPAADALALLAAFPDLGAIAEEENLPGALPAGALADLARELIREPLPVDQALARIAAVADEVTTRRAREIAGPGRPRPEDAERELRKAALKATIASIRAEQDRLLALVARHGAPVPEELTVSAQVAARRRSDLERRLRTLERPG
jgi:DNA primase